jgi:hypothetical protein
MEPSASLPCPQDPWARWIRFTSYHTISLRFILILLSHPRLYLPIYFLHSFTMALGSTQPLTEMNTRYLPGTKRRQARKTDLTPSVGRLSIKCGRLDVPLILWASTARRLIHWLTFQPLRLRQCVPPKRRWLQKGYIPLCPRSQTYSFFIRLIFRQNSPSLF